MEFQIEKSNSIREDACPAVVILNCLEILGHIKSKKKESSGFKDIYTIIVQENFEENVKKVYKTIPYIATDPWCKVSIDNLVLGRY